jgi:hypothetical protein
MHRPTEAECRKARVIARRDDDPLSVCAYQVCRWYRGQVFNRRDAEMALAAIRNAPGVELQRGEPEQGASR